MDVLDGCEGLRYMPKVSTSTHIRWNEKSYGEELWERFLGWEDGGREPFWEDEEYRILMQRGLLTEQEVAHVKAYPGFKCQVPVT